MTSLRTSIKFHVLFLFCWGVKAFAFTPDEAHRLYAERYRNVPPSVQECGEYLFVICEGKVIDERHGDLSRLMFEARFKALEDYIGCGIFGYLSPFGAKMTEKLVPRVAFSIPSCTAVTVEETSDSKHFREVSALEAAPIRAERERVRRKQPSRCSVENWTKALSRLLADCQTDAMQMKVWAEAGFTIPLLFGSNATLSGVNIPVDARAVEELFSQNIDWELASHETCETALTVLPTFSAVHRRLANLAMDEGHWLDAINACMNAAMAGQIDEAVLAKAIVKASSETGCDVWREFWTLLLECEKVPLDDSRKASRIWSCACRSFGRSKFRSTGDGLARQKLEKAKRLYRKGEDLPGIIRLAADSLELDPGNAEVWRCYGDALRTAKRWKESVIAYHESIILSGSESGAIEGLSRVYFSLGFKRLAASAAWWTLLRTTDEIIRDRATVLLKDCYAGMFL